MQSRWGIILDQALEEVAEVQHNCDRSKHPQAE